MDEILSFQNPKIKHAKKLRERKYRDEYGQFFFEGVHLLEELLKSYREPDEVFVTDEALIKYEELIGSLKTAAIHKISRELYDKITDEQSPQGIFCICRMFDTFPDIDCSDKLYEYMRSFKGGAVILDSVRDPGNIGTVIRTAASLGIDTVVVSRDSADIYNPKTIRATMGALFVSDITVVYDLIAFVSCAVQNGINVYASLLDSSSVKLSDIKMNASDCFVIGNEGAGISEEVKDVCSHKLFIPMSGKTESLNAAAAASIIMWEYEKQIRLQE